VKRRKISKAKSSYLVFDKRIENEKGGFKPSLFIYIS